jgi:hypothetical protein
MTEAAWNSCTDPQAMLEFLRTRAMASDRKLRLFACICARLVWSGLQDWGTPDEEFCRKAIEAGERCADGLISVEALDAEQERMGQILQQFRTAEAMLPGADDLKGQARAARVAAAVLEKSGASAAQAVTVQVGWVRWGRWVFENWAPLETSDMHLQGQAALLRELFGPLPFVQVHIDPSWLAWNDGLVRKMAQSAYEERLLPEGLVDRTRLLVLADALEEAGCADEEIVAHLRGPGQHVRGCWPIDLLLGKN